MVDVADEVTGSWWNIIARTDSRTTQHQLNTFSPFTSMTIKEEPTAYLILDNMTYTKVTELAASVVLRVGDDGWS